MYGYGQQGPAQWAGQQQRQQHNSIQNLINMLMRVKMMKHQETAEQGRWDQEQALQEQRQSSLDKFRTAQVRQWDKPPAPSKPSAFREKINALVSGGMPEANAIRQVLNIEPPEVKQRWPKAIVSKVRKHNNNMSREEWDVLENSQKKDLIDNWQGFRNRVPAKEPTKPTVTPTSKFNKRTQFSKDVDDAFFKIQNTRPDDFYNEQLVDDYRKRVKLHLDMPPRYSKVIKYMEHDLATPADQQYYIDAAETKETLDGYPELMSITELTPALRATINVAIAKQILELRKKKEKNILQKARDLF